MRKSRHLHQLLPAFFWVLIQFVSLPVQAHEFWIEPFRFQADPDKPLIANLRVGQNLKGDTLFYLPDAFNSFTITQGDMTRPVKSRTGDQPALMEAVGGEGLTILSYVSTDSTVTYEEPEKFASFLQHEGLEWVQAAHEKRGLPASGFSELYQRFAKALVQVGEGGGQDRALGLRFELVLEDNPYTGGQEAINARLLLEGKPHADARINVFRQHGDDISMTPHTTDAQGRIRIARQDAQGMYLLNAVHMLEPSAAGQQEAVWKSLWASITFEIPGNNN